MCRMAKCSTILGVFRQPCPFHRPLEVCFSLDITCGSRGAGEKLDEKGLDGTISSNFLPLAPLETDYFERETDYKGSIRGFSSRAAILKEEKVLGMRFSPDVTSTAVKRPRRFCVLFSGQGCIK